MVPWLKLPTVNLDAKTGLSVVLLTGAAAGFALVRFLLGLGEAGNFPASIKTVAEWFPKKERAFATGIFNSGTNVGALLTPARGALDHAALGLGVGVHRHRRSPASSGSVWWLRRLPRARGAPAPVARPSSPTSAATRRSRRRRSRGRA